MIALVVVRCGQGDPSSSPQDQSTNPKFTGDSAMFNCIEVTEDNLDEARDACAAIDQENELIPGARTWGILSDGTGERGQMTRWPNGRGAICNGGDSIWGDWANVRRIDNGAEIEIEEVLWPDDDPDHCYTVGGECITLDEDYRTMN
jgi:hypothetical protein